MKYNKHTITSPYGKQGLIVRVLYLCVARISWVMSAFGSRYRSRRVVLCYHGVTDAQSEPFHNQMKKLHHWMTSEAVKKLPAIELTFDDAFANLLRNVLPHLEQYRIPATIFVVTENLGDVPHWSMPFLHPESHENTMTEEHLKSLQENPLIRFGSHTMTHPDLTKISEDQLQKELVNAKQQLETMFKRPIEDLALPHGAYNDTVLAMAVKAGYKRVYTLNPEMSLVDQDDRLIGRFLMSPTAWSQEFKLTCAGAYAWLSPWRRWIRKVMGRKSG